MKILITGGSGLVGSRLTKMLTDKGITVVWLGRIGGKKDGTDCYKWDYKTNYIDKKAFEGVTHVINLAGAGVFDKPWSESYKKEIYNSRIETTKLLAQHISEMPHLKAFIGGSAIGIYGNTFETTLLNETAHHGKDFLATTTVDWEDASKPFENKIRTVKIRIGIVLSKKGGALPTMIQPIKLLIGSPLASGKQIISWIHIDDLCRIFIKAIEDESMQGVYNGVAPTPVSNETFTHTAATLLGKPIMLPNVPAFALRIILGKEKSYSVVYGIPVSASKIQQAGFTFDFPDLQSALNNLLIS